MGHGDVTQTPFSLVTNYRAKIILGLNNSELKEPLDQLFWLSR